MDHFAIYGLRSKMHLTFFSACRKMLQLPQIRGENDKHELKDSMCQYNNLIMPLIHRILR